MAGGNVLTIRESRDFQVGDRIIVEVGGEPGEGRARQRRGWWHISESQLCKQSDHEYRHVSGKWHLRVASRHG